MTILRNLLLAATVLLGGCAATQQPSTQIDSSSNSAINDIVAQASRAVIDLTKPPRDVWDRIRRGFAIPNFNSELTDYWTNYYASRPEAIYRMSDRAGKFLYYIVDELEKRGLPTELALLPFVESAYNPEALSRAKASGLWQFIPSTGRHYNLRQDFWMDLRRDPIASTKAALDYLSYLYDFQGDWYLALASYNWGEGSVKRAVERNIEAGQPADYASLRMPDETRNYVPKLQAIKNIIADPKHYGIRLPPVANVPYFVTIRKTQNVDIAVAAKLAEMPEEEFKTLNAAHNRPVILAEQHPVLLLPADRVDIFLANLQVYQGKLSTWNTYKAKHGESYAEIARKHGITLGQLRKINGLSSKRTRAVAQTLLVPDTRGGGIQLASLDTTPSTSPQSRQKKGDVTILRRQANVRTHTVRRGDTLYALAKRYNTTVQELRKLNNLKGNKLALGKKLRVPGSQIQG